TQDRWQRPAGGVFSLTFCRPARTHLLVRALLIALAGLYATAAAAADPAAVTLPTPLFGDHMVLQQGRAVPIWGSGSPPGGEVTVVLNGQTKVTTVTPDGSWRVDLDAMGAGGPHQLEVVGSNHIVMTTS